MSDGVGESGRECKQQSSNKRVKHGCDEFGRAVAMIAVAQICETEGYQSFQQSALETLSNVAVRYIQNLGKSAKFHANLARRTGCNIFDVLQSLEDFGAVQGFPGASEIDRCPARSGTVKELIQYVSESEEISFACDVPQFPIVKERKLALTFLQVDEEPPGCHIPTWLPAFPKPLNFLLPLEKVGHDDNLEQIDQVEHPEKRNEEHPLLSLHQQMSHDRFEGPSADTLDSSKTNPFLASPLKYGEVEVSPIVFPRKPVHDTSMEKTVEENHVSEMENISHATNQLENHLHASGNDKVATLVNHRAAVKFRIRVNKRYLITSKDCSDEDNRVSDNTACFGTIESFNKKDDKKYMADNNLNRSSEDPEELAQL
ncbi:unnamed protein product [Rhodiola kirilowii]